MDNVTQSKDDVIVERVFGNENLQDLYSDIVSERIKQSMNTLPTVDNQNKNEC